MNCAIIAILILILICLFLLTPKYNRNMTEGFSSDEAVQNIASLYNQAKLTVTNFVSTGTSALSTANIGTLNATTSVANAMTVNTTLKTNALTTGTMAAGTSTLGTTTINGTATVNGTTNVNGGLTVTGIMNSPRDQLVVMQTSVWDKTTWISAITAGNYFTRTMPDGTLIKFLFVYTSGNNVSYNYAHTIKVGNQFLYTEVLQVTGVPNPSTNQSNSLSARGNIN